LCRILRDSREFLQTEAGVLYRPATRDFNEGKPAGLLACAFANQEDTMQYRTFPFGLQS
jgi:hypothetical protein